MNNCRTCAIEIEGPYAKYCYACREMRKKEQSKNQTVRRKAKRKNGGIPIKEIPKLNLPSWMLVRGPISDNSVGSQFG